MHDYIVYATPPMRYARAIGAYDGIDAAMVAARGAIRVYTPYTHVYIIHDGKVVWENQTEGGK